MQGSILILKKIKNNLESIFSHYTGSYVFYVYDPEFTISKVSVTYSDSWLWTARLEPVLPAESEHYTRMQLLWANSANSGAARTGYIYITVSNVKGETY